jgi:cob(I)alamin adenosyltransferase
MGNRLSRITTRTGDAGETGLGDGSRVSKSSLRIHALGEIDELNSMLGVVLAEELPAAAREALSTVQQDLFDLGGETSIPGHQMLGAAQVERLEATQAQWNADLAPLKEFILPGGTRAAAATHLARAVCRRAERALVALAAREPVSAHARAYVNRLSDLLFVLGRVLNRDAGRGDVQWKHKRTKPTQASTARARKAAPPGSAR